MGVTLFDRSQKVPKLTSWERHWCQKPATSCTAYETMLDDLIGQSQLMGELTLGAVPSTLRRLVPISVGKLINAYPGLKIGIIPGLSDDLQAQVERGSVDAADHKPA